LGEQTKRFREGRKKTVRDGQDWKNAKTKLQKQTRGKSGRTIKQQEKSDENKKKRGWTIHLQEKGGEAEIGSS